MQSRNVSWIVASITCYSPCSTVILYSFVLFYLSSIPGFHLRLTNTSSSTSSYSSSSLRFIPFRFAPVRQASLLIPHRHHPENRYYYTGCIRCIPQIRSINIRNEASCGYAADGRGHLLYDERSQPSKGETHQREEYCEKVEVISMLK